MPPVPRPSRWLLALALASLVLVGMLSACSSDLTDASPSSAFPREDSIQRLPGSETFYVDPGSVVGRVNQPIRFRARAISISGDTSTIQVVWTASGGTISSDGLFT